MLPRAAFAQRPAARDGLRYWCKACEKAYYVEKRARVQAARALTCSDCRETKPRAAFSAYKQGSKPGVAHCDDCRASGWKRCRSCDELKPFEAFDAQKNAVAGRRTICSDCRRRERDPLLARDKSLRAKYGISQADYDALLAQQDGGCAICKRTEANGRSDRLYVDHDHETGAVRGLLCSPCNYALGLMRDEPERFDAAAAYLRRSGAADGELRDRHRLPSAA